MRSAKEGKTAFLQTLKDMKDGSPEALRFRVQDVSSWLIHSNDDPAAGKQVFKGEVLSNDGSLESLQYSSIVSAQNEPEMS